MKMPLNKKRKKSSRAHGSHTHGGGFKKKRRGSGHRGGVGMAGTGKRADHKKSLIINMEEKYFGKSSLKKKVKRYKTLNLSDVVRIIKDKKEIDLSQYKILSKGEISKPIKIKAYAASKAAINKVKKAGGEIILEDGSEKHNEAPSRS